MESSWEVWVAHPIEPLVNNVPPDDHFHMYLTSQRRDQLHVHTDNQTVVTLRGAYYGRGTRNINEGTIFQQHGPIFQQHGPIFQQRSTYTPVVPHVFLKLLRDHQVVALWMVHIPVDPNLEDGPLDDASHRFHPDLVSIHQPSTCALRTVFLRHVRNTEDIEISGIRFVLDQ